MAITKTTITSMTGTIMGRKRPSRKKIQRRVGRDSRPTRKADLRDLAICMGLPTLGALFYTWVVMRRAMMHYSTYGHFYVPMDDLSLMIVFDAVCLMVIFFWLYQSK